MKFKVAHVHESCICEEAIILKEKSRIRITLMFSLKIKKKRNKIPMYLRGR